MRRALIDVLALAAGALAALAARSSVAAQEASGDRVVGGVAGFDTGDWLGLGLRLAVVLAVIWGAVMAMRWYVKRMNGGAAGGPGRRVQVVETRALGPNRALHLVRLGRRAVLVGATPERITQLMEMDDPEEVDRLMQEFETPETRSVRSLVGGLGSLMAATRSQREARRPAGGSPLSGLLARLSGRRPQPRRGQTPAAPTGGTDGVSVELTPEAVRSARARSGYGGAGRAAAPGVPASSSREARIRELQEAIAAVRAATPPPRRTGQR